VIRKDLTPRTLTLRTCLIENSRLSASRAIKLTVKRVQIIESKLRLKWSPEQISGWLRETQDTLISHETIYQHIWRDKHTGGAVMRLPTTLG
jgi:IS30 family transposase